MTLISKQTRWVSSSAWFSHGLHLHDTIIDWQMHDMNAPGAPAHARTNRDRKLCLWWIREGGGAFSPWQCVCVPYLSERRVSDTVQLGGALVSQVVKDVEGTHRLWASLLVAENKVNPLMQLTWHKLAFQGLSEEYRASRGERHTGSTQICTNCTSTQHWTQHNTAYFTVHYTVNLPEYYITSNIHKTNWVLWGKNYFHLVE